MDRLVVGVTRSDQAEVEAAIVDEEEVLAQSVENVVSVDDQRIDERARLQPPAAEAQVDVLVAMGVEARIIEHTVSTPRA